MSSELRQNALAWQVCAFGVTWHRKCSANSWDHVSDHLSNLQFRLRDDRRQSRIKKCRARKHSCRHQEAQDCEGVNDFSQDTLSPCCKVRENKTQLNHRHKEPTK